MATISFKIFEKEFKNEISKQAYLSACKWIGEKIIKVQGVQDNVTYKIQKKKSKTPTFIVTIFLSVDENKTKETFCKNCKHMYSIFYQLDRINCDDCKMRAYRSYIEKDSKEKINFYKSIFEGEENESEE